MEKLFDLDSRLPLPGRATATVTKTAGQGPSVPLKMLVPREISSAFRVRYVHVGVTLVLLEPNKAYFPSELENPDNWVPELLHRGMDFSVQVESLTHQSVVFSCEVWGLRKFPKASWKRVELDLGLWAPSVLAVVRCSTCGFVLELEAGSRIPRWCPRCVEDPEGFDSDEGEGDAHDVPTSDAD